MVDELGECVNVSEWESTGEEQGRTRLAEYLHENRVPYLVLTTHSISRPKFQVKFSCAIPSLMLTIATPLSHDLETNIYLLITNK